MVQYKRLTGKTDDELQRIFEKEMMLGVLSSQNLLYPFPGMQRPAKDVLTSKNGKVDFPPTQLRPRIYMNEVDDHIPKSPAERQIKTLNSLKDHAQKLDDHFHTWEAR